MGFAHQSVALARIVF